MRWIPNNYKYEYAVWQALALKFGRTINPNDCGGNDTFPVLVTGVNTLGNVKSSLSFKCLPFSVTDLKRKEIRLFYQS